MLRKILIAFASIVLILIVAATFLYFKILRPGIRAAEARSIDDQKILQPRLVKGAGKFEKRTFYEGEGLGNISQIHIGWPADREGADIAVGGSQGADFIDLAGHKKKQVRFAIAERCPVVVARTSPTGELGYLTRDESWAVPATLFDKEGHLAWRFGGTWPGVNDSAPADFNGDGKLSVLIGFNGAGGLVRLDGQGQSVWEKEENNVWHVETLDTNGDGRAEILHSNARGQLLVRDSDGNVITQYLPNSYVSKFALTRWAEETQPTHILVPTGERREGCCHLVIFVLDSGGKSVAKLDAPLSDLLNDAAGVPVQFRKGPRYFAVLINSLAKDRSVLFLYDDGQLVYQEIIGESCSGLATLPGNGPLLVGCASIIWAYSETTASRN